MRDQALSTQYTVHSTQYSSRSAMRNHILLLAILIAGVACWQWRSAEIDAAAAAEKPETKSNGANVPVKTIDLFTANQLHEKFESVCRAHAEQFIEVHYEGPLSRPAGAPGLQPEFSQENCLRWSVAYYESWPVEGSLQELAIQLFALNVSRERQLDTIVSCAINGEQLFIQAIVSDDPGLDKPMRELSGMTIRQVVERAFGQPESSK